MELRFTIRKQESGFTELPLNTQIYIAFWMRLQIIFIMDRLHMKPLWTVWLMVAESMWNIRRLSVCRSGMWHMCSPHENRWMTSLRFSQSMKKNWTVWILWLRIQRYIEKLKNRYTRHRRYPIVWRFHIKIPEKQLV